jgi:hypothetical protein
VLRRLAFLAIILAACHRSPTDPITDRPTGFLKGIVTIGPNCPVEKPGQICPPPLDAYQIRKVLVYDEAKTRLLFTLDINSGGGYTATLLAGKYTVDMKLVGIDRTPDVPAVVTIHANTVTQLDIHVDTGLR